MNMFELSALFTNEILARNFAVSNKMIHPEAPQCPKCGSTMNLYKDIYSEVGQFWKCLNCGKKLSIFYQSIFNYSNIPFCKILHLLYCWINLFSCEQTMKEVRVDINTVTHYFQLFRSSCTSFIQSLPNIQIGGPGKTVEIDETLMCKRKNNRGRILKEIWIFGGICREDRRAFVHVVDDRKAETLYDVIIKNIAPGTTIISDSWKAYHLIDTQPLPNVYQHLYVDHSQNFIDPLTGAHTQNIERLWRELKRINRRYEGIPRVHVCSHLNEFMWRRIQLNDDIDPFVVAVDLISNTRFIKKKKIINENKNEESEEEEDYSDTLDI